MGSDVVGAQRLEGAGPHVQRDPGAVDAALAERLEQRLVEVQTRRGSGDRAGLARKEALVALAVKSIGHAANVRRQRHRAEALEEFQRRSRKRDAPQLILPRQHPHGTARGAHLEPGADRLAGRELRERLGAREGSLEQNLHATAGGLDAREPRGDHAGVVEHEQVPGLEEPGELAHRAVRERAASSVEHQHAARRALGERRLGDQLFRQLVGKVLPSHARMLHAATR